MIKIKLTQRNLSIRNRISIQFFDKIIDKLKFKKLLLREFT